MNRILNKIIKRYKFNNQNVYKFLKLLKLLNGYILISLVKIIIEEYLVWVIKKDKKQSALLVFLKEYTWYKNA